MSRRLRRSKTRASMGDCADRGAGLSKVGLRARSAPVATPATVTARKIANGDKRIWIGEIVYRSNPWVGEKFRFCGGEEAMPPWVRWVRWVRQNREKCRSEERRVGKEGRSRWS